MKKNILNLRLTVRFSYEVIEAVERIVHRLNDEAEAGALVVVEGRRDAQALRDVGYWGDVYQLQSGRGFTRLTEAAKGKKVVLLLDLDRKGNQLTKRIAALLVSEGCSVNESVRKSLAAATKGLIRHIEELAVLIQPGKAHWAKAHRRGIETI